MTAPYYIPPDPTKNNPPGDIPQAPPPATPPPATLPPAPRWTPRGDEIVNPPPDR